MNKRMKISLLITIFVLVLVSFSCLAPEYRHLKKGNDYYDKGKWNEAIAEYTEALNTKTDLMQTSDLIKIYSNRAAAYNVVGEYDKAIADCSIAIEIDPESIYPYINRSFAYYYKHDFEKALDDCDIAIAMRSYDASLYYHKAMILKGLAVSTGDKIYYNDVYANLVLARQKSTDAEFSRMLDQEIDIAEGLMSQK